MINTDPHTNDWLYIYIVRDGCAIFDRSMPREQVDRAIARVLELKKKNYESFWVPGTTLPWAYV